MEGRRINIPGTIPAGIPEPGILPERAGTDMPRERIRILPGGNAGDKQNRADIQRYCLR